MNVAAGWRPVSTRSPCPVCGGSDNCKSAVDGSAAWCGRVPSDRQNAGGQFLHRIVDGPAGGQAVRVRPLVTKPNSVQTIRLTPADFAERSKAKSSNLTYWCERYTVPRSAWLAIRAVAENSEQMQLSVPECSPCDLSRITAIVTRRSTNEKGDRWRAGAGHSRGWTLAGRPRGDGLGVLVVEGASDTSAGIAAGFEAVGRPTRDASLTDLEPLVDRLPPAYPIVVLVENDSAEKLTCSDSELRHHLVQQAAARARLLADRLLRPIVVATPPESINDFCDWWRIASEGFGHLLSRDDRHEVGVRLIDELIGTGEEVTPNPATIRGYRQTKLEDFCESLLLESESKRQEITRKYGADIDYQAENSCGFFRAFERQSKSQQGVDFMFGFLSCKSWKCSPCRERKLKPEWAIHIAERFVDCDLIFRTELSGCESQVVKDFRAAKRLFAKEKSNYASIQFSAERVVIFSQVATKFRPQRFSTGTTAAHFDDLLWNLRNDVNSIDGSLPRPITTSRDWGRGEPATLDDLLWKLQRIAETADQRDEVLFRLTLPAAKADEFITFANRQNRRAMLPEWKYNFIAITVGESVEILLSRHTEGCSRCEPQEAAQEMQSAARAVGAALGDDWAAAVRTSPAWTPKPSKQWRPLPWEVSPEAARQAAKAAKAHTSEMSPEPHQSFVDGVLIRGLSGESEASFRGLLGP